MQGAAALKHNKPVTHGHGTMQSWAQMGIRNDSPKQQSVPWAWYPNGFPTLVPHAYGDSGLGWPLPTPQKYVKQEPKALKIAQKAAVLHTFGVQVKL